MLVEGDAGQGSTGLQIGLFGGMRLTVGDHRAVQRAPARLASLLGWLVLHDRLPQDRELLAWLLWPESTGDQARTNVRNLLHRLRSWLPAEASDRVSMTRDAVTWQGHEDDRIDVLEFRALAAAGRSDRGALERAVTLFTADLLPECDDEWVATERSAILRVAASLVGPWVEPRPGTQDVVGVGDAVRLARWLVDREPLDDGANLTLFRALARAGDLHGLRRAYGSYEARLRRTLDSRPDPAIIEAVETLSRTASRGPAPEFTDAPDEVASIPGLTATAVNRIPHVLPSEPATFVGRDDELADATALLRDPAVRIVTLTGPGGTGKTRLAIELAWRFVRVAAPEFSDGIHLVSLATTRDAADVPAALADALGVTVRAEGSALADVIAHLRERRMLLLLDNLEQIADPLVCLGALVRAAPSVTLLATSRSTLGLYGEHVFEVPSLSLPSLDPLPDPEAFAQVASVALFTLRATAAARGFRITAEVMPALARICHRLDGLPLALELAAAHAGEMSLDDMADRLERRLAVASGGPVDVPYRHRSLTATLEWSHELLTEQDQGVLHRVSVFVGPWTPEAAEAVCPSPETDVAGALARLARQSLITRASGTGDVPSYRMLETIREYAQGRLEAAGEADETLARHRGYFAGVADEAWDGLQGPDHDAWLDVLDLQHEDLRLAMSSGLAAGDVAAAARVAGGIGRYWYRRGHLVEARRWLDTIAERPEALPPGPAARVAQWAGVIAHEQGANDRARTMYERALRLFRSSGDTAGTAAALNALGIWAQYEGELTWALELLSEALPLHREAGNRVNEARTLANLGELTAELGRYAEARGFMDEAQELARLHLDASLLPLFVTGRADVANASGDSEQAIVLYEASAATLRAAGDRLSLATTLRLMALAMLDRGEHARARPVLLEANGISRELEATWGIALETLGLARLALTDGALDEAERLAESSLEAHRRLHHPQGVARSLVTVGTIAQARGDADAADAAFREALSICMRTGSVSTTASALDRLALLQAWRGDRVAAAQLFGAATAYRARTGAPRAPVDAGPIDQVAAETRQALGDAAWGAAFDTGSTIALEDFASRGAA